MTTHAAARRPPDTRVRDRYLDTLRALALVRVVTYHVFDSAWLPAVFPSLGIMFALAGALVAASLDRAGSTREFLGRRLRRLLLPFWVFGAVVVAVMLAAGWTTGAAEGTPTGPSTVWLWVLPLADPPASDLGADWVLPLWYVRAYLWFLLLSRPLLWLFRRWPIRVLSVPVVVLVVFVLGIVDTPDPYWDVIVTACTYSTCWLLGFAHHDGRLRALSPGPVLAGGAVLLGAGLWLALAEQERYGSWNVDDNPVASALYSAGAVLVLLRLHPTRDRWPRLPTLDAVVTLLNRRALTVYLWGNVCIAAAVPVLDRSPLASWFTDDLRGSLLHLAAAWLLLSLVVLLVGWVEDVAAARRVQVLPWVRRTGPRPGGSAGTGHPRAARPPAPL